MSVSAEMLWSESFSIVASKLGPNSEPFSVNLHNILVFAKCKYYLSLHTSWLAYSTYLYLDTGKSATCKQSCWTPISDYLWSCEGMALFTSHTYLRSSFFKSSSKCLVLFSKKRDIFWEDLKRSNSKTETLGWKARLLLRLTTKKHRKRLSSHRE